MMIKTIAAGLILSTLALAPVAALAATAVPAKLATTSMGKAWVNTRGMALYTFEKDTATQSNCNGPCAVEWPPLRAKRGAKPSGEWTLVARADGRQMWAYDGHPLYSFVDDKKPGQVTGDGEDGFHLAK